MTEEASNTQVCFCLSAEIIQSSFKVSPGIFLSPFLAIQTCAGDQIQLVFLRPE